MECNNCGNKAAWAWKSLSDGSESCDGCGFRGNPPPDVYFKKPYLDPNLVDTKNPKEHNGVWIKSRADKAARMKKIGCHETGDRVHGARNTL